mgnify:CR=1 FL=1
MNKTYYVCKYTPVELLEALGGECEILNDVPEGFDLAEQVAHPNICGFGKAVLEAVLAGKVKELVLVNCCDTIRSVYDILEDSGEMDFLYMVDMLHCDTSCSRERTAAQLKDLVRAYGEYKGTTFNKEKFLKAFHPKKRTQDPHLAVLGARMGNELFQMTQDAMPLPVVNETCVNNRSVGDTLPEADLDFDQLMEWYAEELLHQIPCMRMMDHAGRKQLYQDPSLKGIIYHTVKFCDFYSFEYSDIKGHTDVPLLKIESDYTVQSSGQLSTRLEAFAESLNIETETRREKTMGKGYFAGIDSGSTSTDVVILDQDGKIKSTMIIPTGGGAMMSAEKSLDQAIEKAGIKKEDLVRIVTTGYGRAYIDSGDDSITEITCHAKGANYLNPDVRTVIDIGGQDIKAISIDEHGAVKNFLMNDKCAAGTGRFLEMMARTLGLSLEEMSVKGLDWKENVVISSMCTVFAESEVVSLVAQNKEVSDIIHGLNVSVASKVGALAARLGKNNPGEYMMTGGVAKNQGIIQALEEKLGAKLYICDEAQLCGALGAAIFAYEKCKVQKI